MSTNKIGLVPWFTLATNKIKIALPFYKDLFQWEEQSFSIPGQGTASMLARKGSQFADISEVSDKSRWECYVLVENVQVAAKKAQAMGGKIFGSEVDLAGIGKMQQIADPQGAKIWLYTPSDWTMTNSAIQYEEGAITWLELLVEDPSQVISFYSELFNWKIKFDETMKMHFIESQGKPMGHILKTPEEAKGYPSSWLLYMATTNIESTTAQVKKLGGRVSLDVKEIPRVGKFSFCTDPSGADFYLWQDLMSKSKQ